MEWKSILFYSLLLVILIAAIIFNLPTQKENAITITPSILPDSTPKPDNRFIFYPNEIDIANSFGELPGMPFDFEAVKAKYYAGQLQTERVSEKYWKQPEFHMGWQDAITDYRQPKEFGYSTDGIGAFPSEYVIFAKSNDEFTVHFFTLSAFASEFYQGVRIIPEYPDNVEMKANFYPDNTKAVSQDSAYAKQHIKIISVTPNEFLLEPAKNWQTYEWNSLGEMVGAKNVEPRFESNWVKRIAVKIKTTDLKAGRYAIVFSFVPPSSEFSFEQSAKYLTRYKAVGTSVSVGWQFGVFFDVE